MSGNAASTPFDDSGRPAVDADLALLAARLRVRGDAESMATADELERVARRLADQQAARVSRFLACLSVNHDINNALVGIFGNAQLLGLGPAAQLPGVPERLAVITKEATRIKQAGLRLSELKHELLRDHPDPAADPGAEVA